MKRVTSAAARWSVVGASLVFAGLPATAGARDAYVANENSDDVSILDVTSNFVAAPIAVGDAPTGIAATPAGDRVYVTSAGVADRVVAIDTRTRAVGPPVFVGNNPVQIAITPDGTRAYVTNDGSMSVSVIDLATNQVIDTVMIGAASPSGLAIHPDGSRAYVSVLSDMTVRIIDTATNELTGSPISVGLAARRLAITPDGRRLYVPNNGTQDVSVIDTGSNQVVATVPLDSPMLGFAGVGIAPDGSSAYVPSLDGAGGRLSVIDTATNAVSSFFVDGGPEAVAVTPDGSRVLLGSVAPAPGSVFSVDIAAKTVLATPIVGSTPQGIAVVPNQGPTAAFTVAGVTAGQPQAFDASASSDSDGTILSYAWDFGDGATETTTTPTASHTYAAAGTYGATLTVTDNEGCSASFVYTGQTASCNGGPRARAEQVITVANPADSDPPAIRLGGKKKQRADAALEVRASCDEACSVSAAGRISVRGGGGKRIVKSFRLGKARASLPAGRTRTLKLRIPRAARRGKGRARITVTAADGTGNQSSARRTIRLKP